MIWKLFSLYKPNHKILGIGHSSKKTPTSLVWVSTILKMSVASGCRLKWSTSVGDIVKRTSTLINYARSVYDKVGSSKPDTFESVVLPISMFEAEYQTERNAIDFPQHTFPCKAIRDASCDATRKLSDVEVELEMRKDVFEKFVSVQKNIDSSFSDEYRRYVDRKVQLGRRNGLHLDDDKRKLIEALNKEENQLCIDFQRALNEENTLLEFTDEELTGCPADFIDGLKKLPSGKREVSLKYPHYFPIMQKASNPETRRTLETAFNSRCVKENSPILKRLMELRKERATILGFPTHADFMLDLRMAKTALNVDKFLSNVGTKLKGAQVKETARLLELKKEECDRLGYTFNNCLNPWDTRYYMNMVKERDYSVDEVALKKYFPLATVKSGILRLYQQLLGLRFERVSNAEVWHEEVEMYSVSDSQSDSLLGYFYLDLHPREGKYGHAAVFGLQPGCRRLMNSNNITVDEHSHSPSLVTSERQLAIAAMVANFTAPDKETGQDFVECPSQMLENWVWNVDGLKALLGTNDDPIPKDLLASLINSRIANAGLFYSRQILLASFDQAIHTTNWEWSEVFSADMFESRFQCAIDGGCLSKSVGRDYREKILRPGGSKDAADMLKDFLGREPNDDAFFKLLNVNLP
ncbi:thimet oligopeptidase [Schistosoma bovis]|uniref:Thimet oligopeptidase n=1 Tax=Schistosoma bovis TaxID=6184 RepID=A0A430QEH8_SCHBO|nr:thimet oligopeptidase [Schistosoma bovis]